MKRAISLLAALALLAASSTAFALYSVIDKGAWPDSWPKELEPFRKTSRTLIGPQFEYRHYEISFTKREDFEAAWPHLVSIKSKGAPIILVRKTNFFKVHPAGVLVHTPPLGTGKRAHPETPIAGQENPRSTWRNTSYIELVVDGEIVDLNRIEFPPDTPIIDKRFRPDPVAKP